MLETYIILTKKTYHTFQLGILFLFLCACISQAEAKIWVFDINDTITVENRIDPAKGFNEQVVIGQLIAQNLKLTGEGSIKEENYKGKSVEDYIKGLFPAKKIKDAEGKDKEDKTEQRNKYEDINNFAAELVQQNLLPAKAGDDIKALRKLIEPTLEAVKKSGGFFPSFFKAVDKILEEDPEPIFLIQSFGKEIKKLLDTLGARYEGKLKIAEQVYGFETDGSLKRGQFQKDGGLKLEGNGIKNPKDMRKLLQPFTINAWRNNYDGWMAERFKQNRGGIKGKGEDWTGGKVLFYPDTIFYDDNADVCSWVWNVNKFMTLNAGYKDGVEGGYITKVDTLQALIDEDYFINSDPFVKFLKEKQPLIEDDTAINAVKRYTMVLEQALAAHDVERIKHYSPALAQLVVTGNVSQAPKRLRYDNHNLQSIATHNYEMSTERVANADERAILYKALSTVASVAALGGKFFDMEQLAKEAPNQAHANAVLAFYKQQWNEPQSPLVSMFLRQNVETPTYEESPYAGVINYNGVSNLAKTNPRLPNFMLPGAEKVFRIKHFYPWIQTIYGTDEEIDKLDPFKFSRFLGITLRRSSVR